MAMCNEVKLKKSFMGKLNYGSDLLEELTKICQKQDIHLGKVQAIGAVQKARLAYYEQATKEYCPFEIDKNLEIAGLLGNVSIREQKPMIHAHITLADKKGNTYAGHLMPGTIIFACEFIIEAYEGPEHIREYDNQTGLPLWRS